MFAANGDDEYIKQKLLISQELLFILQSVIVLLSILFQNKIQIKW